VALNKPVIDGSGAYSNNPFDVPDGAGNFIAQNVTDGSTADESQRYRGHIFEFVAHAR
jgi:hypothetical protein